MLHSQERLAQCRALPYDDAFQPVVADHAAPERVVQVEHQAFSRAALQRGQQAPDQIAIDRAGHRTDLLLGAMPEHRVMPLRDAMLAGRFVYGQKMHAGRVGVGAEGGVEPGDQAGR